MNVTFTAFWKVVYACLIELGKLSPQVAGARLVDYRTRLLQAPQGIQTSAVYNIEPWQLALRLSGKPLRELTAVERQWYDSTYEKIVAEASVTGSDAEVMEFSVVR